MDIIFNMIVVVWWGEYVFECLEICYLLWNVYLLEGRIIYCSIDGWMEIVWVV